MMLSGKSLSGKERNCAFLNLGNGTFATVSGLSGFDIPDDSRSVAICDWDNDGRLDALLSARTAPALRFFHNEHQDGGDWLKVRLSGGGPINRDAIGTRLELSIEGEAPLVRQLRAGEGYLSQSQKLLHFGLGRGTRTPELQVTWPDGTTKSLGPVERNRAYHLIYPDQLVADTPPVVSVDLTTGSALPSVPFSHEGEWRLVYPVPLPPLALSSRDNSPAYLPALPENGFRLLNLWNPSCAGCVEELEGFAASTKALEAAGIEIVAALGPGDTGFDESAALLEKMQAPFTFGSLSAGDAALFRLILKTTSRVDRDLLLPTSFLIDANDLIVAIYRGPVSSEDLLADVETLRSAPRPAMERATHFAAGEGHWISLPAQANMFSVLLELMTQQRIDDADRFIRKHNDLVSRHKDYDRALVWLGDEFVKRGLSRQALVYYHNALRNGSSDPLAMNNVAWQLATNRDPAVRNGREALKWAQQAVTLTKGLNPSYLDTLAAAYAETGDFPMALATVDRALQLVRKAGPATLLPGLQKARELYLAGIPYRE